MMPTYDIAFSLNKAVVLTADSPEDAEIKIKQQLKDNGINTDDEFTLEIFDIADVNE